MHFETNTITFPVGGITMYEFLNPMKSTSDKHIKMPGTPKATAKHESSPKHFTSSRSIGVNGVAMRAAKFDMQYKTEKKATISIFCSGSLN